MMRRFSIAASVVMTAFLGAPCAIAQSALERVLTLIAENPELSGDNVFLNLASHGANVPQTVDSSVRLVTLQDEKEGVPQTPLELQIDTLAMGATNTGLVRVITPSLAADGAVPMIVAANAATTRSPILAPIDILGNAPVSDASRVATRAMGSVNTGVVQIVIKPGANE
jgi:hypothetical protein